MAAIAKTLEGQAESALTTAVGFGVGLALSGVLAPTGTGLEQGVWSSNPNKVLDPETAAKIVAEAVDQLSWGQGEAAQSGINPDRFGLLVNEIIEAPGFGELVRMLRRETIGPDLFRHGLRKAKLDPEWDEGLTDLIDDRLDPAVIATSIQRGTMRDPGYLPVGPPTEVGVVPPMPVSPLDPEVEAAASGINPERLAAMTRIVGLPPAPGELLQLINRGEIQPADFFRGVAEGNTRNEWGPALLTLKRRLLTPHEYEEAALRGVLTPADADAGAALSGMEAADAQLLFEIMGRPLPVHQITTGLERGGSYGGSYTDIPEPYRDAVRRSNIRPEYAGLAHANRYTIPSYFILRAILNDGGMTPADFAQYGKELGWPPDLAEKAADALSGGKTVTSDPHVSKAETQLWNALHKAYVDDLSTAADTRADLARLGVADAAQPEVLGLWDTERGLRRRSLTPAQIKKAIGPTGWTEAEATTRLLELGYDADDVATFLAE